MGKLYDLAVKTGEYEKDGQRKNRYKNIGAMWEGRSWDGEPGEPYITLDASFNPAGVPRKEGSDSIFISLFKVKPKEDNNRLGTPSASNPPAPAETYIGQDGSQWQQQSNGNWTKIEPPGTAGNYSFKDGPEGMNETADIPF